MALITQPKHITKDELHTLARVTNDPFFFSTFVYVIHPLRGKVQFALYPFQKAVLYQFVKERFNIVLKFRQAGITELISMYCLWLCMYHPNKKVNIISIKDTTAKKVLKKIKFMYKNLPPYLQTPIINGRPTELGSSSMMEFSNGSFIESVPTSPEAGRSESLTLLVIDEAAMVRWANEVWAAALPTLSCSVGSTPLFTRKYVQVREGVTKPITTQVKLRELCPKYKGVIDISSLGLYTLTHTGKWQKILKAQNKGKLETWFVKDNRGKRGGYTPAHRLYTTKGWKTLAEIVENDLNVIQVDTKGLKSISQDVLTSIGSDIQGIKLNGNSRVYISKLKVVKKTYRTIYDIEVENDHSYISATNFVNHNTGGAAIINSCITGDTEIIGRHGNFRVEQVCPKEFGVQDISFMNIEVLTHKLQWRKALYGVNKGILETWEIENDHGDIIKCTPAHKFLTPKGWLPASKCIEHHIPVIRYDSGESALDEIPKTEPPKVEIIKPIPGFPNYEVSNLGYIYYAGTKNVKEGRLSKNGYLRVKLWHKGKDKTFTLSRLIAESFIGKVPAGYVVDHIDCNPKHNYVTNLQILTVADNTQRAVRLSRSLKLNTNTGKGAPDLQLVGYIRWLFVKGRPYSYIIKKVESNFGLNINRAYVTRVVKNLRCKRIELSYLKCKRVFSENIYDITVEGDESYITTSNYVSHNTPKGIGNFYHSQWADSISGGNGFNPIRLYWNMHPERDDAWYYRMSKALGPRRTAQEIDGDFLSSGNTVFDLADIKAIEDCLSDYPVIKVRFNGQYRQFLEPDPEKKYYIGADVATGRGSDYSSFTCMDRPGEEQVVYKGRISVDKFAKLLGDTGELYNYALIAPESNDVGLAVTSMLQTEGYPNLYYYQKLIKQKGKSRPEVDKAPGWLTTNKNRAVIIEALEKDIREGNVIIKDPFFVNEAYTFIYDGLNRPVAMGKHKANTNADDIDAEVYSDDDIFGKAITNHIRKGKEQIILLPQ